MDELVLLIDRWLKHSQHGVIALLQNVPRQSPENTTFDVPDDPKFYNDVETEEIINGDAPPGSPALVVFGYRDMDLPETNRNVQISPNAIVAIGYSTTNVGTVKARRESGYVLRAVKQSLHRYNKQGLSDGYRELNGVKIAQAKNIRYQRAARGVGSSQIWGFVLVTLDVMDKLP